MDKIETMRAFIAVAQEGSFTSAGRRLGLSTKLVSKYVQHLEGQLKTQLFNRTTRSVSLTGAGRAGSVRRGSLRLRFLSSVPFHGPAFWVSLS